MNSKRSVSVLALLATVCGACFAGAVPKERTTLPSLPGDVRGVTFSPDGKWIAVSTGTVIKLWEWETGKDMKAIDGGNTSFSGDGTLLAFPGQNKFFNDGLMIWSIGEA